MPHTTSNEIVSPTLGTIPTLDVWDDPRSLTTFRTFHSPIGNGNVSETSFYTPLPTNGSQQNGGHENTEHSNGIQNSLSKPNENLCKVKLGSSKLKGLVLNQVKPVTPPQAYKDIVKFDNIIGDRYRSPNGLPKIGFAPKPLNVALKDNVINQNSDDVTSETNDSITANGKHATENGNGDYPSAQEKQQPTTDCDVVVIDLGPTDKRFGFSVVGGCDEGFLPRIESITPGKCLF